MTAQNKKISLFGLEQLALIIKMKSTVTYAKKTGGHSRKQPKEEGVLVLIDDETKALIKGISRITLNKTRLTVQEADEIDQLFQSNRCDFLAVDRGKLNDSMEAWLNVVIDPTKADMGMFEGFEEGEGVITWNNSD